MPLTAAEAWCWASMMLLREADVLYEESPWSFEAYRISKQLERESDALYARARKLDGSPDLWERAMDKFHAEEVE